VLNVAVALVPVVVFLAGLTLLDSFRLVRPLSIAAALAYGAAAAGASLQIHEWLVRVGHVPATVVGRFLAPVVEESAKAAFLVALLVTARIAFLVDAASKGGRPRATGRRRPRSEPCRTTPSPDVDRQGWTARAEAASGKRRS
jgi:hypothetical protein